MSRIIDNKIIDNKEVLRTIAKKVRWYVENSDIKKDYLATMIGVDPSRISQMLGTIPSNDETMYKKILTICGYKPQLFLQIKLEAIKEHYGGSTENPDPYFSLAEKERLTEGQLKKVRSFIQFVKSESE